MRLIDADARLRYIDAGHLRNRHEICFSEFDVATMVDRQPTIEATPVVRGKWMNNGDYVTTAYGHLDVYKCSNCNEEITIDNHDSFCPHCGARMDGDSE